MHRRRNRRRRDPHLRSSGELRRQYGLQRRDRRRDALFPIYHKGAYFYLGDGHALQGDGEGLGTGIETSLDVQFTVKVRKGKPLSIPRLINDDYIISIGSQPEFHSSTDYALRIANSDMLNWLTSEYHLTLPEANLLMGA